MSFAVGSGNRGAVSSLIAGLRAPRPAFRGTGAAYRPTLSAMAPQQKRKNSGLPAGYKEDTSKEPMLRYEESLPKLPVPTLEATAKRYLKSVHALLSKEEYENTRKAVESFVASDGFGQILQKRLLARRDEPGMKNWMYEWWNNAAYLAYRDPVVPYVSYFYSHRDDRRRRDPAKRAAAISTAVLEFKKQVDEGTLEPEYVKKLPIAMSSYKWMFNACRIPAQPADYPVKYPYKENAHIVVTRKNQFFKVKHEVNGRQLTTKELEQQFRRVYQIAEKVAPVGVMTSENRDTWTEMRDSLIRANPANLTALQTIESASFVVCLDDAAPITFDERAHQYWHGDGQNRWYDKPCQFIVNDNGTSGFMGEHSMMDGTPTHRLNDYLNDMIFNNKLDFDNPSIRSGLPDAQPVKWHLLPEQHDDIAKALAHHSRVLGEHELRVQAYQGYGKGLIKKFKCSPDAYVQMVIQLAYHKFYGKNRPTYESAATRRFQQGRTETCRSVSDECVAFCDGMADPHVPPQESRERFMKAITAHVQYLTDAGEGKGVDRHLFGLKKLIEPGEKVPEIYNDPAFTYSSTWYISSSQLSSEFFNGYGWSQVIDEGWGVAYMINENSVQFNIVSKHLGCDRMSFFLNEAAGDIRDLMMPTVETKPKL